jgi:hypothetical protein
MFTVTFKIIVGYGAPSHGFKVHKLSHGLKITQDMQKELFKITRASTHREATLIGLGLGLGLALHLSCV